VTEVSGSWVEPTVTGAGDTSIWVGIDGYNGSTVEQIGVQSSGPGSYTPWIEFYGEQSSSGTKGPYFYETPIPLTVHAGDTISAYVRYLSGTTNTFAFSMTVTPGNGGPSETYNNTLTTSYVTPQRSTAEWIVENPNNGAQAFEQFTPVNFTSAWAQIGSQIGPINSFSNVRALNLSSSQGSDVTSNPPTTAPLSTSSGTLGSNFQVKWTGGPAPSGGVTNSVSGGVTNSVLTPLPIHLQLNTASTPGFVAAGAGQQEDGRHSLGATDLLDAAFLLGPANFRGNWGSVSHTQDEATFRPDRATTAAQSWVGDLFLPPAKGHRTHLLDAIFSDPSSW
jgi:hypothetical protein